MVEDREGKGVYFVCLCVFPKGALMCGDAVVFDVRLEAGCGRGWLWCYTCRHGGPGGPLCTHDVRVPYSVAASLAFLQYLGRAIGRGRGEGGYFRYARRVECHGLARWSVTLSRSSCPSVDRAV